MKRSRRKLGVRNAKKDGLAKLKKAKSQLGIGQAEVPGQLDESGLENKRKIEPLTEEPEQSPAPTIAEAEAPEKTEAAAEAEPKTASPQKAVVDRFEGDLAVLLVGDEGKSVPVPRSDLPKRTKAGHWLKIELAEDDEPKLLKAERDPEETERAKDRISEKLAKLRSGEHRE